MKLREIEKRFVDFFIETGQAYGLNDLSLKILAILYLEPDFISMNEIAKKTGYSLGSISTTMKMLESVGVLSKKTRPGSKKIFYYMEKNLIKINIQKMKAAKSLVINPAREKLPAIIEEFKNEKDPDVKKKLKFIIDYKEQVSKFDKIMEGWIKELEKLK